MNFECCICMTNEVKLLSQLNSNNLFYSDCIDEWLKQMDSCPMCREEHSDFNNIEQIRSENEILKSKCKELREEQSIIKKMAKEKESLIEEKNMLKNKMKAFKSEIEELEFKEKLIQHEKVREAEKYINFIKSLEKNPENIKYVKPKNQTVYMIETALIRELIMESEIIDIVILVYWITVIIK